MTYDTARALALLRVGCGRTDAAFRDDQEEAIRHVVEGRGRLLVVQKTGWGKSFVYFIATKLLRDGGSGPALLISPLLALMRNQIAAAERMGVRAATINSDNPGEWSEIEAGLGRDEIDILLISPERLANERFRTDVLADIAAKISLLVIDEAHCISDWGHDFRPHYRLLERIVRSLPPNLRLLATTATANDRVTEPVVDETRLHRLLGRGFLLSQVVERWQSRAIWVVSRADANYPGRLKSLLREDAPAVLYGCGNMSLLESGGLAIVGSRNVDETLIAYTKNVGRLTAGAGKTIVSGGARGIDQAAMLGALEQGGKVIGVLADNLEKNAMNRENRNALINGQLVLISSCDPSAGFNVGNAMRRNRLIYALAEASLVVNSDFNKGGTWAGATEQLDKLHMVPVYVRSTGELSDGLQALLKKGAIPWPNPQDVDGFKEVFNAATSRAVQAEPSLFSVDPPAESVSETPSEIGPDVQSLPKSAAESPPPVFVAQEAPSDALIQQTARDLEGRPGNRETPMQAQNGPADVLLAAVREAFQQLLAAPMKDSEVAAALNISTTQARIWLRRLVDEGVLEKHKKSNVYVTKQFRLFE